MPDSTRQLQINKLGQVLIEAARHFEKQDWDQLQISSEAAAHLARVLSLDDERPME